jgi:hypothetical protein
MATDKVCDFMALTKLMIFIATDKVNDFYGH